MIRIIIIFFLIITNTLFAEIKKVNIVGNSRVNSNTIELLVDKKTTEINSIYINNLTKKIYDTDFFSDVKILYNQDVLTITVSENPIVNFFYINGIQGDDLDQINKTLILKENSIFSSSKLKKDLENIKDFFRSKGYYESLINPEVIKIDSNQVNLIINIDKKDISNIKNIYFIGSKIFSSGQLLDVISSTEDSWWKLFSSAALNDERVDYDKQLLKDFYKSKGFYDVQIESAFANLDKKNNFSLTFSINAGKKYKFLDTEVKSNSSIYSDSNINEIKNISENLLRNKSYSPLLITKLNKEISAYLDSKRLLNFEINIQENKKEEEIISTTIFLNELPKALVNKINIQGNIITEEKVIRDSLLLSEGDQLNSTKIKKSIDNLKSKQLFSKVDYKINDTDNNASKNINFIVKEQATGNISAGVGYGTNGGLLSGSINERNFLGQGINLNFTGTFATEKISGEFSYIDPNFKNSNKELVYSLFSESDDYSNSAFKNKKIGNKVSTKYEIYEDIFFRPNATIQLDRLDAGTGASNLLKSRKGDTTTTALGYNFFLDVRDSRFIPTSGYVAYFDQNVATLFSDIPALQTTVGSTYYKELFNSNFIGSVKTRLSNVTAFDNKDAKLSDRLFASSNDIRGFQPRGIGPVDGNDHVGGNYLATLSLKSSFPNPIPDGLRANSFLFYDVGNVWGVDYSDVVPNSSKIRSSTGVALDIVSPIGPLSFTYSIPLSKVATDKEQKFLFNIGSSF